MTHYLLCKFRSGLCKLLIHHLIHNLLFQNFYNHAFISNGENNSQRFLEDCLKGYKPQFSSVAQSGLTLQPHGLQHTRRPCPSPTPGAWSNSCPSSWWCHPTISSSVVPFSSCLQSFPVLGPFPMSQFFASGGWSVELQLQHQSFQWTPRTDLP